MHWAEDRYWLDALARYQTLREGGTGSITLDLAAIEQVAFDGDGPAYRCLQAMGSVLEHEGDDGYRGAPRLVFALLMRLAEQRAPHDGADCTDPCRVPGTVSLAPPSDARTRRALRVLAMVHELHKAGYQRLRICAGYTLDLRHWRCYLGPATSFYIDGWTPTDTSTLPFYTTEQDQSYFGWDDAAHDDARHLAAKFIERHPELVSQAAGEDWAYAGWFARQLGHAEQGHLPEFFGGRHHEMGQPNTSVPPPCSGGESYSGTGQRLLSHDALTRADLPASDADYEHISPFCLSFDGYRACVLAGADAEQVMAETEQKGLDDATLECLRITAFMLQRTIKWSSTWPPEPQLLTRLRAVLDQIRKRVPM